MGLFSLNGTFLEIFIPFNGVVVAGLKLDEPDFSKRPGVTAVTEAMFAELLVANIVKLPRG